MENALRELLKDEIEYFTNADDVMEMVNYYNQNILKNDRKVVQNSDKDIIKLLNNDLEWYFLLFSCNDDYNTVDDYVMLFTNEETDLSEIKSFDKPIEAIKDLDKFIDYVIDHEDDFDCWINFDSVRSQLEEEEGEED